MKHQRATLICCIVVYIVSISACEAGLTDYLLPSWIFGRPRSSLHTNSTLSLNSLNSTNSSLTNFSRVDQQKNVELSTQLPAQIRSSVILHPQTRFSSRDGQINVSKILNSTINNFELPSSEKNQITQMADFVFNSTQSQTTTTPQPMILKQKLRSPPYLNSTRWPLTNISRRIFNLNATKNLNLNEYGRAQRIE